MVDPPVTVLYGDSTPSILPPDILSVLIAFADCSAVVAGAYQELGDLQRREQEKVEWTGQMLTDVDDYRRRAAHVMRSTVRPPVRPEIAELDAGTVAAALGHVDEVRRRIAADLERERAVIAHRRAELMASMRGAVEEFVVPLRARMPKRIVARVYDGQRYRDEALFELVEGVRPRVAPEAPDASTPRRVKSLLAKGARIHVGTKLSRLRKVEEPAVFVLDDLIVENLRVSPGEMLVVLTKKPGAQPTLRLELTPTPTGVIRAVATRSDGVSVELPRGDAPVINALWSRLRADVDRVIASPARLVGLTLDGRPATESEDLLAAMERIASRYRPVVAEVGERSSNREELSIKVVQPDGRREEVWIERDALGRPLAALRSDLRRRIDLVAGRARGQAVPSVVVEVPSAPLGIDPYVTHPGAPEVTDPGVPDEVTMAISLSDLEVLMDDDGAPKSRARAAATKPRAKTRLPRPRVIAGELQTGRHRPLRVR